MKSQKAISVVKPLINEKIQQRDLSLRRLHRSDCVQSISWIYENRRDYYLKAHRSQFRRFDRFSQTIESDFQQMMNILKKFKQNLPKIFPNSNQLPVLYDLCIAK